MSLEEQIAKQTAEQISKQVISNVNRAVDLAIHYRPQKFVLDQLSVSQETLKRMTDSGEVKVVRFSNKNYYDVREINNYFDKRKI